MDCTRDAERYGLCYRHYLRTIGFTPGHLRNNLHPGATIRESVKIIQEDARKAGIEAEPVKV
jgi:hypothetical protein